jgi:hypothetical protein
VLDRLGGSIDKVAGKLVNLNRVFDKDTGSQGNLINLNSNLRFLHRGCGNSRGGVGETTGRV